jgi:hypothetical protein
METDWEGATIYDGDSVCGAERGGRPLIWQAMIASIRINITGKTRFILLTPDLELDF